MAALLLASLLLNATLLFSHYATISYGRQFAGVSDNPLWAKLLDDDLPVFLVVGDYYLFGETGPTGDVRRLIRDFTVNSSADLQSYLHLQPEHADEYVDLDFGYLPTSVAFALRDLMPILSAHKKQIDVVLTSEVSAHMLKTAHVVYVGYLSGMGPMLEEVVFAHSRFSVGDTYDTLVDSNTNRTYVSQAGSRVAGQVAYKDYGYVSSFTGPNGNQILIISGTRDVAVMQMAEMLSNAARLRELWRNKPANAGIEAVYEVSGIDRLNMNGRLLGASSRGSATTDARTNR